MICMYFMATYGFLYMVVVFGVLVLFGTLYFMS